MYLDACHEIEDLGGRRRRLIAHPRPVAYRRDGVLRAIVQNWSDSGIAERPHLVTEAPLMVTVAPDGMRRIHPTREDDRYLELGAPYIRVGGVWQKAPLGAPERSAHLLTWTATNANMYVAHGGHFVKLAILLKNGWVPANRQFAFPIGLTGLTRDGGQVYADGVPVMRVRKPTLRDLDDPNGDELTIAHEYVQLSGQWYVLFTLPAAVDAMSRPLVDPTLDLQPDAAGGVDTYIMEGTANGTQNTNAYIYVRIQGGSRDRGLLYFDVSSIPAGSTVDSATLYLTTAAAPGNSPVCNFYAIAAANAGWIEASTWNFADGAGASQRWAGDSGGDGGADAGCSVSGTDFGATLIGTMSPTVTATEYSSALTTSAVQAWVNGANYGIVMDVTLDYRNVRWCSSDDADAGERPQLVVVYTEAGGASGSPWYAYAQQ